MNKVDVQTRDFHLPTLTTTEVKSVSINGHRIEFDSNRDKLDYDAVSGKVTIEFRAEFRSIKVDR